MQDLSGAGLFLLVVACVVQSTLAGTFADLNKEKVPNLVQNFGLFTPKCSLRFSCYQGRSYYIENTTQRTRDDAARYCTALNMELVSVEDCAENAFITNLLKSKPGCGNRSYWISAHQNGNKKWSWLRGSPLNYTNWMLDEPSYQTNGYCVQYRYNYLQWDDENCNKKSYFICESDVACE